MFVYINGRRVWVELQEADTGGNSGGGDKDSAFQRLLDRYKNDAMALSEKLYSENYQYRERQRQLEQQVTDLTGKVPTAESVVLSGDDAKAWVTYKALGKPEEVKQAIDERTQLQGKLQGMERDTTLRSVAETVGYKASVLSNLDRMAKAEGKALAFELRDTQVDGKPVKVAYVKDGDKDFPLTEYANTNWADFLPALAAASTGSATGGNGTQQATGTRYIAQHAGAGTSGKPDPVAEFLAREEANRAKVKNPLVKE